MISFPRMVNIYFSYVCNSKCPSCPFTTSNIRGTYRDMPFMPSEIFKKISDEVGDHGSFLRISGGGEPVMHPNAVELFEYAKAESKSVGATKIGIITNGSCFTNESTERILKANVDMIEFSVDAGTAKEYEKVRTGLDWGTVLSNAKRMVELRNKLKSKTKIIASVINQEGIDVMGAERFWQGIVDYVQVRKFLTWGISQDKSADKRPYMQDNEPCPFILERLNIDTRGDALLCGYDIRGAVTHGNVLDSSIEEIWNKEVLKFLRGKHLERKGRTIPMCASCTDWKYRSWDHNYWKILRGAEKGRKENIFNLLVGCGGLSR